MPISNDAPASKANPMLLAEKPDGYRHFRFFVVLAMVFGIIVASVSSTSPTAATVVTYAVLASGVVGAAAGAWYGFFFNISNHCTGGRLLCGIIGGLGAAALGAVFMSLLMTIVGTVTGFAAGWIVGSLLPFKGRAGTPWIGAGIGALIQAAWAEPVVTLQAGALGAVLGVTAGPVFLLTCAGLAYGLLRKSGLPRHPERLPRDSE